MCVDVCPCPRAPILIAAILIFIFAPLRARCAAISPHRAAQSKGEKAEPPQPPQGSALRCKISNGGHIGATASSYGH
eukprot:scaffold22360_cov101-Isochrysis_galbana.AAC.2